MRIRDGRRTGGGWRFEATANTSQKARAASRFGWCRSAEAKRYNLLYNLRARCSMRGSADCKLLRIWLG
jgi:hypothetical protein